MKVGMFHLQQRIETTFSPSLSFLRSTTATACDPTDRDQRTACQGHPLSAPGDAGADEFQAALADPFLAESAR